MIMKYPHTWKCLILNKIIQINADAIPNEKYGFICDCITKNDDGYKCNWVKESDKNHTVLSYKDFY